MKTKTLPLASLPFVNERGQLDVAYDREQAAVWFQLNAGVRPCYTPDLLAQIDLAQRQLIDFAKTDASGEYPLHYLVAASDIPGIYSLGGDLDLFRRSVENRDRDSLRNYAFACIDVLFRNYTHLGLPLTTIALVEGRALGGGFESALSCNVIIAEEGTEFGFPEILFNLFPGMGAYSLLARRVSMSQAEKIIASGRIYRAEELYEMGVVDVLAPAGDGRETLRRYIESHSRTRNGFRGMQQARERVNPLTHEELADVTEIWVETALALKPRDLHLMDRLVRAQTRTSAGAAILESAPNRIPATQPVQRAEVH